MVERTSGSRGVRRRGARSSSSERVPRFHCDFCKRDISRKIRIKCAECPDFDLCVECFAVGVEYQEHKKTHRYRVIDDLSFAVFSSNWGADEELLFFDGVCEFGISNWEAVANFVGSKSAEACRSHYVELLENHQQQWMKDVAPLKEPLTAKDVSSSAFALDFDSDAFGSTPQTLSPASSVDLSVSSESMEEKDVTEEQEWMMPVTEEMSKSSQPEAEHPGTDFPSDLDATFMETEEIDTTGDEVPHPEHPSSYLQGDGFLVEGHSHSEDEGDTMEEEEEGDIVDQAEVPQAPVDGLDQGGKRKAPPDKKTPVAKRPAALKTTTPASGRSLSLFDTNAGEVTGYNPFRREFDPPYDVGAEHMIADLEFLDDDPEEVTKAKLRLLNLYRWRVHERERRTEMLKKNKFGLMDVRKIIAMERTWGSNEKLADLRPFARFLSLEKVERLAKGMCFERTIRKRIQELQEARSTGCRSFVDIRAKSKDLKCPRPMERTSAQLMSKWRRCYSETPDAASRLPIVPELSDREKAFCQEVGFSPWQYAVLRDRMLREAEEHGYRFSKAIARTFFRLDTTQAVKLFDFFVSEGLFINADKDVKDARKHLPPPSPPDESLPEQKPNVSRKDDISHEPILDSNRGD